MEKFYKTSYFNCRNWLMEHIKELNLDEKEFMLLMMIDFFNEQQRTITLESLSNACNMELRCVDETLSGLCLKRYLQIVPDQGKVNFKMDGIFEQQEAKPDTLPLFTTFEQEFGRPLTQKETMMLSEWMRQYQQDLILYALREAAIYRKLNVNYIDTILSNWEKNNITVSMLEEGKEHEIG